MTKQESKSLGLWEFWSRFMTIVQFLVVVGVGTYLTVAQMKYSQQNLYAESMLKFDEKFSKDRINRLIIAIEDGKPLLRSNGGVFNEDDLEELLGDYDELSEFYKMGLINKKLIYEDFSYDLLKAYNNQEIKKYLNQVRGEDGADFYIGLDKLAQLFKESDPR
jgi:hypothetical protein